MTLQILSLDDRLGLDKYEIDEQSHITVDHACCERCELKPCLTVCPAAVYVWADEKVAVRYENCLECGTCLIACPEDALTWHYPRAGYGVQYRFG